MMNVTFIYKTTGESQKSLSLVFMYAFQNTRIHLKLINISGKMIKKALETNDSECDIDMLYL